MTLRIGVDLDGVLADLGAGLDTMGRPEEPDPGEPPSGAAAPPPLPSLAAAVMFDTSHLRGAPSEVWGRLADTENFWETLGEIEPGIVRRLSDVSRSRRWEVIFLTSRPPTRGDPVQLQSQRWLAALGFPLPAVFVTNGSRGRIASALALDVVVDDNPEHCLDVAAESTARSILVWRGTTDLVPTGVRRLGVGPVRTMSDCLSRLERLDASEGDRTLTRRFRRVFGLEK